jgi:hypothetical protein
MWYNMMLSYFQQQSVWTEDWRPDSSEAKEVVADFIEGLKPSLEIKRL